MMAKKYALVEESAFTRLKQKTTKPRNPFQNVNVASTKDIGKSMETVMTSDTDVATKQLLFNSLLTQYRDSYQKATGKRKKANDNGNHRRNVVRNQLPTIPFPPPLSPTTAVTGALLPTPPATPMVPRVVLQKLDTRRRLVNKLFDKDRAGTIFGGVVASPHAKKLAKVLNDMNDVGLVTNKGQFKAIDVGGEKKVPSTKIKRAIRSVVTETGAQTDFQRAVVNELQRQGVTI